jgi:hypothetical protein
MVGLKKLNSRVEVTKQTKKRSTIQQGHMPNRSMAQHINTWNKMLDIKGEGEGHGRGRGERERESI